jgi:hypothetical protein
MQKKKALRILIIGGVFLMGMQMRAMEEEIVSQKLIDGACAVEMVPSELSSLLSSDDQKWLKHYSPGLVSGAWLELQGRADYQALLQARNSGQGEGLEKLRRKVAVKLFCLLAQKEKKSASDKRSQELVYDHKIKTWMRPLFVGLIMSVGGLFAIMICVTTNK